jgi:hypothetical protein
MATKGSKVKRELASSVRQPVRKAPGTRMGTWEDWRGGDNKSAKRPGRHGQSVRDGRQ